VTVGSQRVPAVQLAAVAVAGVTAVIGAVYWIKAVSALGTTAATNSRLSYADREIAGGNSVIVDQAAAYRARALIPRHGRYRVVTGSALRNATPLTGTFVADWFRYFLMPRRPSAGARWLICYGCDPARLGLRYVPRWHDDKGISIGLVR
jgi:hypothetical protein